MKRWLCPTCGGGALAPERPRADDARAYCLPCSKRSGRLQRRECPSLERRRQESKAQRLTDAREQRQREAARQSAQLTVGGLDLGALLPVYWRALGAVVRERFAARTAYTGELAEWQSRAPTMRVRRSTTRAHTTGRAWGRRRLVVTAGTKCDAADAAVTLLHELAHCARAWLRTVDPKDTAHGRTFNELMVRAAGRLFGDCALVGFGPTGYWATHQLEAALRKVLPAQSQTVVLGAISEEP